MNKRNLLLFLGVWFGLSFLLFFPIWGITNCNNEPAYENIKVAERQPCVYITNTGNHYHSSSCHYLSRSKIAIGKQQAIDAGYLCCSVCKGTSSGTISVSYTKKVQVDPTNRNIGLSVFIAILLSFLPAVFIGNKILEAPNKNLTTNVSARLPKSTINNISNEASQQEQTNREELIQEFKQRSQNDLNNAIGRQVIHDKFGVGTIIENSKDYMSVMFDKYGIKTFQFPQALIDGFLKLK